MRYIAAEDIARAKEMDLLTYLRNYEPQELVHVSGNTYCTREHDSLRISNGKWCWFSQGIGGRSALDYLIKVKGIPFTQAAEIILGREAEKPPVFYRQKERRSTELLMPELSETTEQVEKYLYSRGIHPVIIRYCLDNKLLFESADYHNAMFVGYDKDGKARDGALRSTVSSYKGELTGSDKHFSFFLEGKPNTEHIHVEIAGVDVFPQGFAAVADRLSDFRGVNMICDIGNGTMNIMFINDKKPVSGNMFTEKYGTHQCLLAVRENVMRAHHTTVDEAIINRVFRFGTADIKEDYLKTITDTATDYVEGIFQRLREHEYNPELMRLYVLGGGSCLIRNFGVYDASRVTINDDICATAKGYEYLAQLSFRRGTPQ